MEKSNHHKYLAANRYSIVRIEEAERSSVTNKPEFVVIVSYWPFELDHNRKMSFQTSDPKLSLPKKLVIEALRYHAEHLREQIKQKKLVEYSEKHLIILRKFCVQHKYKLNLSFGSECGRRILLS